MKHSSAAADCTPDRDTERATAGQPCGVERAKHLGLDVRSPMEDARYAVAVALSQVLADEKQEALRAALGHRSRTTASRWLNAERTDRPAPMALLVLRDPSGRLLLDDAQFDRVVSMLREVRREVRREMGR